MHATILTVLLFCSIFFAYPQDNSGNQNCMVNDIYLSGYVRIVDYNADLNVYIDSLNTISPFEVQLTDIPSECGQWRIVKYNADFTIRILQYEAGSDLTIRFRENKASKKLLKRLLHDNKKHESKK